ncbi:MAG: hypothetical protein RLO48_21525 [Bauldia litoralis]
MALKDLIANKSEVDESVIETIVSKYVRYYTDTLEIGFTPEAASLGGENKVLVYLVALLGWQYVTDEPPVVSTKPADLEKALAIPGGSLRPFLKNLKDAHLIASGDHGYTVRAGNLEAVAETISGERKRTRRKPATTDGGLKPKPKKGGAGAKRTSASSISVKLEAWVKENFFKMPRTLSAVHKRLHEQGVIVPQTSVSGPLLRAVQQGRLTRKKVSEDGKEVWAYCLAGS